MNPSTSSSSYRVLISAGETSGDLHASAVIQSLQSQLPEGAALDVAGIAGPMMQAVGCRVVHDMSALNVMGIAEVISALPRIYKVQADLMAFAITFQPHVVVLTDFTSFHLSLGKKLRARGFFVIHYIAPKLWAWGEKRISKLQQSQDKLACIFPFEEAWFGQRGVEANYVGNPSAFSCRGGWSKSMLKDQLGLSADTPLLALLPGSRSSELYRHVQLLADVFVQLRQQVPNLAAVATLAPGVSPLLLQPLMDVGVSILRRTEDGYALRADAAVAVSGTATLELALWDTPTVLVYRTSALSWYIGQRLVKGRCVGLANILLLGAVPSEQGIIPELLQGQCTIGHIQEAVLALLNGKTEAQLQAFQQLREMLGEQNPAQRLAQMCWQEMLKKDVG